MLQDSGKIELATAYLPENGEVEGGRNIVLETNIETDRGQVPAYVKLMSFEKIAKEALCAILAKTLGLPVKQPYYVNVNNLEPRYSRPNLGNLAFGVERGIIPPLSVRTGDIEDLVLKWTLLVRCGIFDEWIGNSDRYPRTSFSFEEDGTFWIFDHDDAFPELLLSMPENPIGSQLLSLAARGRSELELHMIRREAISFEKELREINWELVKQNMRIDQAFDLEPYVNKYIDFLIVRMGFLTEVVSKCIGLKQVDMFSNGRRPQIQENRNYET